jgi:hypothetical protein
MKVMKIGSEAVKLYQMMWIDFGPSSTYLDEIRYRKYPHNTVEYLRVS